ncbi:MAG: ATP synthase F0 subunit B, partial [Clostridia bacterium]
MLSELFNPVTILLHVLNACVLFTALYFLLYKPVRKFMKARSAGIEAQLTQAEDMRKAADAQQTESQNTLQQASKEAA